MLYYDILVIDYDTAENKLHSKINKVMHFNSLMYPKFIKLRKRQRCQQNNEDPRWRIGLLRDQIFI